jgi:lipoprotein-anchoring transpeptidase ErfK/SrfK
MMSKILALASLSAVAALIMPVTSASAFHPFDAPTGYEMPDWSKRKAASKAAADKPARPAKQTKPRSVAAKEDNEPAKPQRAAKANSVKANPVKNPPVLDGGGRPAISPAAPPVVAFAGGSGAGTIIIDTRGRALYYTLSATTAYRYPISVGRDGFTWTGTETISRVASWPDWRPPSEMKERQPNLPDVMTGGVRNPLGAKALYQAASSGCFRMTNSNVIHLASIAGVGTTVRVVHKLPNNVAGNSSSGKRG